MASTEAAGKKPAVRAVGGSGHRNDDRRRRRDRTERPPEPAADAAARDPRAQAQGLRRAYRSWRYHNRETHFGWTAGIIALAMLTGVLFVLASLLA